MSLLEARASARFARPTRKRLAAGMRDVPEPIVLGVEAGVTPSSKPPVRIFLGTQPEQHRAERVFFWSVLQVRDPSRVYEIHLMKSLRGFDQRGWATGFTNYRFAIPEFAGRQGKAIYNDVDQIYLSDPAELFDLDLGGHGFLAISPKESSVMLIDCARMSQVWPLVEVQRLNKGRLLSKALAIHGCCGPLAPEWNARDEDEFDPASAKCVHFTTLHTQPWRPTPQRFVYLPHPLDHVWSDLERDADLAGFQVFTRESPSILYRDLINAYRSGSRAFPAIRLDRRECEQVAELNRDCGGDPLLGLGIGGEPEAGALAQFSDTKVELSDLASTDDLDDGAFAGVLCLAGLEEVPSDDVPWVLERLFGLARCFVFVRVDLSLVGGGNHAWAGRRRADWWGAQMQAAARRNCEAVWRLVHHPAGLRGGPVSTRDGGPALSNRSRVWVLTDDDPGKSAQALGLAEGLGLPFEERRLTFNPLSTLPVRVVGKSRATVSRSRSDPLRPPWPAMVIAAGRRTVPVARWISRQSRGRTRLVQIDDRADAPMNLFDAVITPRHAGLWPHPARIGTLGPLSPPPPGEAPGQLSDDPEGRDGPRIVLFLDTVAGRYRLTNGDMRSLAADMESLVRQTGGSYVAVAGADTDRSLLDALGTDATTIDPVPSGEPEPGGPLLGHLAGADILVVAGGGTTLLAAAAATDKPLYIQPLPERPPGFRDRLGTWVRGQAFSRPENSRGTTRPQQGLEYLCARLIEGGLVVPPSDLAGFQQALLKIGRARKLGDPLAEGPSQPLRETEYAAQRLRALLIPGNPDV